MATKDIRRENFDVSPEQQAEIETLQAMLNTNSKKEAVLIAVQLALHVAAEARKGNQFFVGHPGEALQRLIMLGIEKPDVKGWMYLTEHAHPWKKQLYVKGRKLPAAAVWSEMAVNKLTVEDAMENWDLPKEVILEVLQYCEANKDLLQMEAAEEERLLQEKGVNIGRQAACR
ncbi:MAG TPA: hypothetical protein V6C86_02615 [Oculatellaceae cyanobacterium]